MKKIAVLTSGGDAPGMNAAIRAVVRTAVHFDMGVYGVEYGYDGLINGKLIKMDGRSVSDTVQRGGTILKTARSAEFMTDEGLDKAAEVLKAFDVSGLVVIGGDGSFRGMKAFQERTGIACVGIPGTIDNDLAYTDFTLGFDTAVNTVLGAINSIRDTMTSHGRACIIEVMGRHCGDIAVYAGLAGGAEEMLVPEIPFNIDELCETIRRNAIKGKTSDIIILAEGVCDCNTLKTQIEERVPNIVMRTVKLGYIQRGGTPTMADRILAARCGALAVELLKNGEAGKVVGIRENKMISMDIGEALSMKDRNETQKELYRIAGILAK